MVGEISRYMNLSCVLISRILSEAIDGFDNLVEAVNKHNEVLDDVIIPKIFNTLYEVKSEQKNEDVDVILLKEPKGSGYYEFSADENLVIEKIIIVLLLRKSRKAFMPTHIALIQSQRRNASYSIFQVKRSKKYTLRVCLRPIREIYLFSIMIQNQNVLGSIIRISWLR